jgi:Asp-tRNA(Asn)/Glu-tRNA(Gln) amidotransferase A subunit family amidase
MMDLVGKTTQDPGYLTVIRKREALRLRVLKAMADHDLDAIVYPTFNHQPGVIPPDVLTNPRPKDEYAKGDNRALSPAIGFPALVVPAGLTTDGLPVGLEFLGRPFSEPQLLRFGYAYEQATQRRRPPTTTPPLGAGR